MFVNFQEERPGFVGEKQQSQEMRHKRMFTFCVHPLNKASVVQLRKRCTRNLHCVTCYTEHVTHLSVSKSDVIKAARSSGQDSRLNDNLKN